MTWNSTFEATEKYETMMVQMLCSSNSFLHYVGQSKLLNWNILLSKDNEKWLDISVIFRIVATQ